MSVTIVLRYNVLNYETQSGCIEPIKIYTFIFAFSNYSLLDSLTPVITFPVIISTFAFV